MGARPIVLRVRDDALERVYRVVRPRRGPAVVVRETPGREPVELERSSSWTALARAVLEDSIAERPRGDKLARDLGRFIVPPRGGERPMSGEELDAWLATWRPPLDALFPDRLRRRPAGGR